MGEDVMNDNNRSHGKTKFYRPRIVQHPDSETKQDQFKRQPDNSGNRYRRFAGAARIVADVEDAPNQHHQ